MTLASLEDQMKRVRLLLSPSRVRTPLSETSPEHNPTELGALGGLGFTTQDPTVKGSVYFFADKSQPEVVLARLKSEIPPDPNVRVVHSFNGPMLFFGHTRTDGPQGLAAKHRLLELVTAFAPEEE